MINTQYKKYTIRPKGAPPSAGERRNTQYAILFFAFLIFFFSIAFTCFPQQDNLVIKGKTAASSLVVKGGATNPPAPVKGTLFYRSDEKIFYVFDGTSWQAIGGGGQDKRIATIIVAASDSLDPNRADEGYRCDGTDDQTEINNAINALPSYGGAVYLLEGTYNLSASVNINKSNVSVIGTGAGTVLQGAGGEIGLSGESVRYNILISQLRMINSGIGLNLCRRYVVDKIWQNGNSQTNAGIGAGFANGVVSNSYMISNRCFGFCLGFASAYTILANNHFSDNGNAGTMSCPNMSNTIGGGISTFGNEECIIIGNIFDGNFFDLSGHFPNHVIFGNQFVNSANAAFGGGYDGVFTPHGGIVASNLVSAGGWSWVGGGAQCWQGSGGILLAGNIFSSCSNTPLNLFIDNSLVFGNILYENEEAISNDGMDIQNTWKKVGKNLISSNYIYDSASTGYGINLASAGYGSTDTYLVGNFIDGDGYIGAGYDRRVKDDGTNTKYTDKMKMTLEETQVPISVSSYNLDVATNPKGYVQLNPSTDVILTLSDGKSAGDLLTLENISDNNKVTVEEDVNRNLGANPRELDPCDILKLVWNGSKWLELKYVNNN